MYCAGLQLRATVRIAASVQYWKFFTLKAICPAAELEEVQTTIDRIAASFKPGDGLPEGCAERMRAR